MPMIAAIPRIGKVITVRGTAPAGSRSWKRRRTPKPSRMMSATTPVARSATTVVAAIVLLRGPPIRRTLSTSPPIEVGRQMLTNMPSK